VEQIVRLDAGIIDSSG